MPNIALIDSGPLIALFNQRDKWHQRAVDFAQNYSGRAITNVAILTEVTFLLAYSVQAQQAFLRWIQKGAIEVVHVTRDDLQRVMVLLEKYADRPMDFADATLVAVAERMKIRKIASVDADFSIYRYRNRQHFENIFLHHDH